MKEILAVILFMAALILARGVQSQYAKPVYVSMPWPSWNRNLKGMTKLRTESFYGRSLPEERAALLGR